MYLPTCPTFLLPYRRYASTSLMPLARDYVEQDRRSYQRAVTPQGRVIGYVTPANQARIDERALHRSTLWRFLGFLGAQTIAFLCRSAELTRPCSRKGSRYLEKGMALTGVGFSFRVGFLGRRPNWRGKQCVAVGVITR
jgi:hypothetical protein